MTKYRAYDPTLARWLSRDPLKNVEMLMAPNLFAYAGNDPVNKIDLLGLLCCSRDVEKLAIAYLAAIGACGSAIVTIPTPAAPFLAVACIAALLAVAVCAADLSECQERECPPAKPAPSDPCEPVPGFGDEGGSYFPPPCNPEPACPEP